MTKTIIIPSPRPGNHKGNRKGRDMGLYQTKFWFRNTFAGWTKYLIKIDPDLLSYLAVVVSAGTGICLFYFPYNANLLIAAFVLILLRMALNTFDGMIAIAQNKKTLLGEIVNALPDRVSDVLVLLGLVLCPATHTVLGIIAVAAVLLISYTGMLGKAVGVSWQHQGPAGKVDRLVALLVAILAQYLIHLEIIPVSSQAGQGATAINALFVWYIIAAPITIIKRLNGMIGEIQDKERKPIPVKGVVIYDSRTGNTEKVAHVIAEYLGFDMFPVKQAPADLSAYEFLVLGSLNIRAQTTPPVKDFIGRIQPPLQCALFTTFGMPVWGPISSIILFRETARLLSDKGCVCRAKFMCPGYHVKFKTYPRRPDQNDLKAAKAFARNIAAFFQ